jgi:hypothetical protein
MTTMPDPYERITFRGKTVNRRTAAMLSVMEQRLGYELTLVQGSYNAGGVAASAGTHDGGGAVDLAPFDWRNKCHVGREVGFDIWHRLPSQGPWSEHNHGIAAGDREASSGAKVQETEYNEGLDGLADHAHDPFPFHPSRPPVFDYAAWWRDQQAAGRDDILRSQIKGWRAKRKKIAERISALRSRRAMLKAKIKHAQTQMKEN